MGGRSKARILLRLGVVAVLFGTGVAGQVLLARGQSDWATAAVGAALVTLISMGAALKRLAGRADSARSIDDAVDALAVAVRRQWEAAAQDRGLVHPAPVPVRWQWTQLAVTGPVMDAVGDVTGGVRFLPLPGMARVGADQVTCGGIQDLFAVYAGIDSGRLIVVGSAGAGKTGAAVLLVVDALKHRERLNAHDRKLVPVPVLLNCRGWDPVATNFETWMADQLQTTYRFLRAAEYGADAAGHLVAQGRIAVLLDGFDELPEYLRPQVLGALNTQATCRLVLLTRGQQLADAVIHEHLAGAAALELLPVSRGDAADYLERCRVHPASKTWQRLVSHVRTDDDVTVAHALDTPLTLSLVRDTFHLDEDAADLLTPGRFASSDEVVGYLLRRVLPAAYTPRPGRAMPPYTLAQASEWLGYVAWQMNQEATRDIAWWQIPRWRPPLFRAFANGCLAAVVFGLLGWLSFGAQFGWQISIVGLLAGTAVGLFAERHPEDKPVHLGRIRWRTLGSPHTSALYAIGLFIGLGYGTMGGIVFGLKGGPAFGVTIGIATAVSLLLATSVSVLIAAPSAEAGSPIDPLTAWRRDRAAGLVVGTAFAAAFGVLGGIAFGLTYGAATGLRFGIAGSLIAGAAIAVTLIRSWDSRLAFVQLWRAQHTPLLLLKFLEDARSRNILRTIGPVYQFRHARLQDLLAHQYHPATAAASAARRELTGDAR